MKKTLFFIAVASFLMGFYGCKNPCKGIVTYPELSLQVLNYFFKPGTYWVYKDSATGDIDSQYVYYYLYRQHFRNPADSPNKLYNQGSPGGLSDVYCGPYYQDNIEMHIQNYVNGLLKDTFTYNSLGLGANSPDIVIYEHDTPSYGQTSVTGFALDWSKTGFQDCCYSLTQHGASYDTTGSWYNGILPTSTSGIYTFTNVYEWGEQIGDGSSIWFAYPVDLYIVPNYGVIKMVQHLPLGDVRWDLINYHIVN